MRVKIIYFYSQSEAKIKKKSKENITTTVYSLKNFFLINVTMLRQTSINMQVLFLIFSDIFIFLYTHNKICMLSHSNDLKYSRNV